MADLGKRNFLRITRESSFGLYLDGGDLGEILLPRSYVKSTMQPEAELDVFIYRDSEDRLVATTETPLVCVGEIAVLTVTGVHPKIGAFLDWGLQKDLLLPHREQLQSVQPGDKVVVFVMLDEHSGRITATTRLAEHLSPDPPTYKRGQAVSLVITRDTPLGYNAIIEMAHLGLLYRALAPRPLAVGDEVTGYIQAIRPDGRIDLTMESTNRERVTSLSDAILAAIKADGGKITLTDTSPPELIRARFDASKRAFKQAVGGLLKQGLVHLRDDGVYAGVAVREAPKSAPSASMRRPRYLD